MTGTPTVADTIAHAALDQIAADIASGLTKADLVQGRAFIRTPVLLPSGSTVVVVVQDLGGGRYHLSDLGQGWEEAEQIGMARIYQRQAETVAVLSGITFTGRAFILADATQRQLTGGTMTVANAVARTAERTVLRADQRPQDASVARLVGRLGHLFPNAQVATEVDLHGASEHAWHFDALVTAGRRRAVFDIVTPNTISVAFASAKFHDLAALESPPARVAVIQGKAAFGDLLSVIAQAAHVVEQEAPDRAFIRAADLLAA